MPNETELLRFYEDGHLPPDHLLKDECERAFRSAYLTAAEEASQWDEPDFESIDAAYEARHEAREHAQVEVNGIYLYKPGHEVEAARTRGRHHALVFVEYAWDHPQGHKRLPDELADWYAHVARWAAELTTPAEYSCPPCPDDSWPRPSECKPAVTKPVGNLEWLRTGKKPEFTATATKPKEPEPIEPSNLPTLTLRELVAQYPELRKPVIHGLLREGETMNVIASPKTGKSWFVSDLAIAVATGGVWLDTFPCEQGRVLILDNELHKETSAHRLPKVVAARGLVFDELCDHIEVANLRGELKDIFGLGRYFAAMEPGKFKVIILDAFYRFMPKETDENDNGTMAQVYNVLDLYAAKLGCCFILIHHSTKGVQSGKAVTDVGAGAGAQSRAADSHLILRQHEEEGVVVLDAAVRSWPPIQPICLRWTFPVWPVAGELDPTDLKADKPRRKPKPVAVEPAKPTQPNWNAESFAGEFITSKPAATICIIDAATSEGLSEPLAKKLLKLAEAKGLAHRWKYGANRQVEFATIPQPKESVNEVSG